MKRSLIERLLATLRLGNADASLAFEPWSDADTVGLLPLLQHEGAELWFYRRVQQNKVVVPDVLKAELRLAAQRVSIINMRIDAQTIAVTSRLNDASISWALLKGQARRAAIARFPNADARQVSDVDLLVPKDQAQQAWQLLVAAGFRRVIDGPVEWSADHHLPTLIDDNNVAVELHTTTSMAIAPEEAWRRVTTEAVAVEWSEIQTTVPSATELVWQALAHGAADGAEGFLLKAFLSVAAILATDPKLDWVRIERRMKASEVLDNDTGEPVSEERLRRFFAIAADLAGITLPASLTPQHRAQHASLLRWRATVLTASHRRDVRERLLEEGTRVEAFLPITPYVRNAGAWPNLRRRLGSVAARIAYYSWRAWGARR
ncbi:MAG: nucleotidyltransferase family protein [Gemmatimonas sp.]